MSFISYAQNYEDVMLWRALKHVERGFYIDVGAYSPESDSVTKAFYEMGWRGINIEPNLDLHAQLQEKRPHDINLCVAVGDKSGSAELNVFTNPGLSTLDESIARKHVEAGLGLRKQRVELTTLAQVCESHVSAEQQIHFMKIDVEGYEEQALRGNDWKRFRPWILVVEATRPMTEKEEHGSWEPFVLKAGYRFAYADGLNRFYVSEERKELLAAFRFPPNFFDGFKQHAQLLAEIRANEAEARAAQARANAQWLASESSALQTRLEVLGEELVKANAHAECREAELRRMVPELENSQSALAAAEQAAAKMVDELTALQKERNEALTRIGELDRILSHWSGIASLREKQLQAVYASRSWRLTWPYRVAGDSIRRVCNSTAGAFQAMNGGIAAILRTAVLDLMRAVIRHPRLKDWLKRRLERFPGLWLRLAFLARAGGLFPDAVDTPSGGLPRNVVRNGGRGNTAGADRATEGSRSGDSSSDPESNHLGPSARRFYRDLKRAVELSHGK